MFPAVKSSRQDCGLITCKRPGARGSSQVPKSRLGFRVVLVLWPLFGRCGEKLLESHQPKSHTKAPN